MTIPILLEPVSDGFRASTGGPLELSAHGQTAAEAMTQLQAMIARRLSGGAVLVEQPIDAPRPPISIVPLAENPLFDQWLAAVENYRAEREATEAAGAP